MNKRITKVWYVGLVVAMLASLLMMAAPVSAKPLQFTNETIPTTTNIQLRDGEAGADVVGLAVGGDGTTIYAACGTANVTKSTDGGVTWAKIGTNQGTSVYPTAINASFIAVAPDNNDLFVIAGNVTGGGSTLVYVSQDGGTTFGNLNFTAGATAGTIITGLTVSADYAGDHYVAISGYDGTGAKGNVWYYKLGIGGSWLNGNAKDGFFTSAASGTGTATTVLAVAFSPNFASDQVLTAVTRNASVTRFEMFSVNLEKWNLAAGFVNYPAEILDTDGVSSNTTTAASIALAPTYLGGDEVERNAFVGLTATDTKDKGVNQMKDYQSKQIKSGVDIWSVAYDGTNLVAGETVTGTDTVANVWRSADPLDTTPTFYVTDNTKSPGGATNAVVAWAGVNVVAGTTGTESAFAVSIDNGKSFNDLALIDTLITNIEDVAVSADGNQAYFLSDNVTNTSLWRKKGPVWQRVLSLAATSGYIVRIAPTSPDVVYVAKPNASTIYYSNAGGDTKWYSRSSRYTIQDMAVESESVAYIGIKSARTVSKSTNAGFTWATAEDSTMVSGSIFTITSLAKDNLIVAGTNGYVAYSTDGNESWTKILQAIYPDATPVNAIVVGFGLNTGDYLFGVSQLKDQVRRWQIGQDQTVPWKDMEIPTSTGHKAYGAALKSGVLYVATTNATGATDSGANTIILRTLEAKIDAPDSTYWSRITNIDVPTGGANGWSPNANIAVPFVTGTTPTNLVVSGTPAFNKLWVINIDNPASPPNDTDQIPSYMDMLALPAGAPKLSAPADAIQVKVNPISGTVNDVPFTWGRPSEAFQYQVRLALDKDFNQIVNTAVGPVTELPTVSLPVGPGGNSLYTASFSYDMGTTYYWKVRVAQSGPLYSPWSETRSFTVEAGPGIVPTIAAPANGATVTAVPAFSWSPVSQTTKYQFQLATDPSFATTLADTSLATTAIQPTAKLDVGKTYFWRVRAVEPIMGDWSAIANFTLAAPPPPPAPPVVVKEVPAPIINIPAAPPAQQIVIPPAPAAPQPISQGLLWAVIIIGAVLVIAVIVLIVRTRRAV